MSKWDAVSDLDYYDEQERHLPVRREPRCQTCDGRLTMTYDGNGNPLWGKCWHCATQTYEQSRARLADLKAKKAAR